MVGADRKASGKVKQKGIESLVALSGDRGGGNTFFPLDTLPLAWAAYRGINKVAGLLLVQSEVNADLLDFYGRTPLSWSAGRGHDGVVKLLLARKGVNPNIPEGMAEHHFSVIPVIVLTLHRTKASQGTQGKEKREKPAKPDPKPKGSPPGSFHEI